MNKIDKYLNESKETDYLKSIDLGEVNYFQDNFDKAYENLQLVVDFIEAINDDPNSNKLFKKDLSLVQSAWASMRKVKIRKII